MELTVTLDHFFQDWDTAAGRLWLCVQPHVVRQGASPVTDWVRQSADGSQATYRMAALSATMDQRTQFVPVPFTDNCRIEVVLLDGQGQVLDTRHPLSGAPRASIVNDLAQAFQVTDPALFFRANRTQAQVQTPGSVPLQPVYAAPFALGYNHTLRDAVRGVLQVPPQDATAPPARPLDETGLQQMLTLGFWGGTRRVMPSAGVAQTDRADWMQVGEVLGEPEVNLHSLCGLLFHLGGAGDLQRLSEVRALRISVVHPNGTATVQDLDSAASRASIAAFFSALPSFPPGQALRPTFRWQPDFARRVYAVDDGSAFLYARSGTAHWFLRPPGRRVARSTALRRLLVTLFQDNAGMPRPSRLHLRPYLSFGIALAPYRSFPSTTGADGLLELTAHPDDAARLDAFLADHPGALATATFFEASGTLYAQAPALIGTYEYPWDVARRGGRFTMLYWGRVPPQSLILRLPVFDGAGRPALFVAEHVLPGGQPNPFGDRWEAGVDSPVQDDFDALSCAAADGVDDLLPSMVATAVWPGEVAFEFAQSASSIEGNMWVDFENPPEPDHPSDVTPQGEYKSDLVNFNALNVYYGWSQATAGLQHLNPDSELYPVKETPLPQDARLVQHYVFRERPPAQVPPAGQDARSFFKRLFDAIPGGRTLRFDIEHTYGPRMAHAEAAQAPAFLDFPPLPASKVAGRAPVGSGTSSASTASAVPTTPFLTCRLAVDPRTGNEWLVLVFETRWLDPAWQDDERWGPVHVQAWRSVAELAFAQELSITASCLRFDHVQGAQARDANLLRALTPDAATQALFPKSCTALLQALAQRFLGGNLTLAELPILVSSDAQPRISTRCHVVEFNLQVKRTENRIPLAGEAWDLLRLRSDLSIENLYDARGQRTLGPAPGDAPAFTAWLASLAQAAASIEPETDAQHPQRTALLRKLLAGSDSASHQWIAPAATVQGDGRASELSVCPVGFRPLADEGQLLQGQTSRLVARYMEALAAMLDCRSTIWAATWTGADAWRRHFDALQQRSGDVRQTVQRAVALLLPLPDAAAPNGDPAVVQSVVAWHDPQSGVQEAITNWAIQILLADPAQYASAKALLYTRLWGHDGQALSSDFFELRSEKLISDHGEPTALVDRDVFTYRQGLSALAGSTWFGFGEVLDDARYDSSFVLQQPVLIDFETMVARVLANDLGEVPPAETAMPMHAVHTPALLGRVPLASRERIANPAAVFSGEISLMGSEADVEQLAVGALFDRSAFLLGRLATSSDPASAVQLLARTPTKTGRRNQYQDDYVLSAIIAIRGDEESLRDWTAGWENDHFYLRLEPAVQQPASAGRVQRSAAGAADFFTLLAASPDPAFMRQLEAGYGAEVFAHVQHALQPAPVPSFDDTALWYVTLTPAGAGLTAELHAPAGAGAGEPPMIEAFVFRPVTPLTAQTRDLPQAYLVINWLCKVWEPQQLTVLQTRNIGAGFAPEFGSAVALEVPQYQPFVSEDLYRFPATTLEPRTYALEDFLQRLLGRGMVEDLSQAARFDLSVTLSHDQFVQVVGEYLMPDGTIASQPFTPTRSALPVLQVLLPGATPWSGVEIDLGSFPYANAVVDFQWSSDSNLQFFRLHSRRITIQA